MTPTNVRRRLLSYRVIRFGRNLREFRRLHRTLTGSVLFDKDFYEGIRRSHFPTKSLAVLDYLLVGSRLGLLAGPLCLPPVSRPTNAWGIGATAEWSRLLRAAGFPRRSAHPAFDDGWYSQQHLGANSYPGGPLAHYLSHPLPRPVRTSPQQVVDADLVELATGAVSGGHQISAARLVTTTSVLVPLAHIQIDQLKVLNSLLPLAATGFETVVLLPAVSSPDLAVAAAALAVLSGFVVATSNGENLGDLLATAVATASGETLVIVASQCDLETDEVLALASAVRSLRMCQPALVSPDGSLHALGRSAGGTRLFNGLPVADATRRGEIEVPAVSGEVFALRSADLAACGGFGTADTTSDLGLDLSHRFVDIGGQIIGLGSQIAQLHKPSDEPIVLPVPGYLASGHTRWAIKSPHPAGQRGRTWGDYHFAHSLARALERLDQEVAVDPLDSWYRPTTSLDDVVLVLRGLHPYRTSPNQRNLLWVISHPELISDDEVRGFDVAYVASTSWAVKARDRGLPVTPLLQCTDSTLFSPETGSPGAGWPVLFVGNSRGAHRPLIQLAASQLADLAIVGSGWEGRVDPRMIKDQYLANEELSQAYRSAGVVLNDHWADMADEGFLSNRLFDLTAAGARWISDPVAGLTDVFPTGRTAASAGELAHLLSDQSLLPTESELLAASEEVLRKHSFDARAAELVAAVDRLS